MLYVDSGFTQHPKVVAAGGDAGWLWLCGYGYVDRYGTAGFIPKQMVPQLSDRKAPKKLAAKLVEVGLWEDRGDSYYMHDFEIWNAKAIARKEAAKKAADAKWAAERERQRQAEADANAAESHMRSHSDSSADAMPYPSSHSTNPDTSSSNTGLGAEPLEDEGDASLGKTPAQSVIRKACRLLAEKDLAEATHEIKVPENWLAAVEQRWLMRKGADFAQLLRDNPSHGPSELARRARSKSRAYSGFEPRPKCDKCDADGMIWTDIAANVGHPCDCQRVSA